jgi:hypothetical protein
MPFNTLSRGLRLHVTDIASALTGSGYFLTSTAKTGSRSTMARPREDHRSRCHGSHILSVSSAETARRLRLLPLGNRYGPPGTTLRRDAGLGFVKATLAMPSLRRTCSRPRDAKHANPRGRSCKTCFAAANRASHERHRRKLRHKRPLACQCV